MKNKILISSVALLGLMLGGCTTTTMVMHDDVFDLNQPERIVKHNFENKYGQTILTTTPILYQESDTLKKKVQ